MIKVVLGPILREKVVLGPILREKVVLGPIFHENFGPDDQLFRGPIFR